MKQRIRKAVVLMSVLLCAVIGLSAFNSKVYAAENAKVTVGSASATVGEQVSVTVSVKTSSTLVGGEIWISYDSSILDYVSGGGSGGGGNIRLLNAGETSYTLTFSAKAAGTSTIGVSSTVLAVGTELNAATTTTNGTITVNAPVNYSTDNTLSSLSISPGVLSPAFSPNVTEYTTSVGADCAQLIVSAAANDANATVSVSGTRMDPGSNTTTITVKAQNGASRVYKITTTKASAAAQTATEPATQIQTTPDGQTQVQYNDEPTAKSLDVAVTGASYTVNNDFNAHPLPSGYEAASYDYNGQQIQVGKGTNTKLILMYLDNTDGKGTSGFYVYDAVTKAFTPYNEVAEPDISYVILPITDSMEKPEGYSKSTYTINGKTATVLMAPAGNYCLFYGVSSQGVTGWFTYNCTDGTIQPYVMTDGLNTVAQTASTDGNKPQRFWQMLAIAMSVAAAGLLVAVIVLAGRTAKNKKAFVNAIKGPSYDDGNSSDILEDSLNDDLLDSLEDDLDADLDDENEPLQEVAATTEDHAEKNVVHAADGMNEDDLVENITRALLKNADEKKQDLSYEYLDIEEVSEPKDKQ